jgi:8-amino-3,8-dideoxy-alpha-D-manno-octulosonate transaminase
MTELQAAVGLVQLGKLSSIVERNRAVCALIEDALRGTDDLVFRAVPPPCRPLCDCLIFELPTRAAADAFAAGMEKAGLGTKNLPSAFEWHFAGYWDHIFARFGLSKEALWEQTRPSYERLSRCIAVPVMVKYSDERAREIGATLKAIAAGVKAAV